MMLKSSVLLFSLLLSSSSWNNVESFTHSQYKTTGGESTNHHHNGIIRMRGNNKKSSSSSSRIVLNIGSSFPFDDDKYPLIDTHHNTKNAILQWVYPRLVEWKNKYGTPNIPLNMGGGKACQKIRNLHIQQKLSAYEVEVLEKLGFQFELQYEDLYWEADFDTMFSKLLTQRYYTSTSASSSSTGGITATTTTDAATEDSSKSSNDPELDAWVKGIRLLGKDRIQPEHALRLTYIGFQWKNTSQQNEGGEHHGDNNKRFRLRYDEIKDGIELYGKAYIAKPEVQEWISKQRTKRLKFQLNDTKYRCMIELLGDDWMKM